MRLKRDLFFTLILFLIIFSISFVSASELTYDSNTDELTTLSVSDVNSIEEDLNDVKLDSVEDNSNDELIDSVDENLDESELNSIDDTSSPSLDLEDEEQDIDEIESNDCLTLNNKAQLLRASNDEDILGAGPYTRDGNVIRFYDDGTVSNIMDAINELNDLINSGTLANGVVCLDGHTFSGSGNLNDRTIRNIWVIGGHDPWDYSKYATFSDTGIAMWFSGTTMDNCRFSNIISVGRLASCSVNYDSGSQTFRGSMSNTIFEYCQSYAQFISYNGNRGNAPSPIQNQTIPLEPGWNGQTYKVTNCQFLYCNQTFNGFEDGHGQFCAALAADFDGCKFINTTSGQHSGAICIADESEWGPGYVPSSIKNCDFINVTSRWFAVYIHGRYSTSPYSGMYGYEVVENCNFINCTGTDEYSAGLGISHDNVYIKNCNFTDNKGGQGTAIMVGGISKDKGSMGDTAFNGDNTKGNNITIIDCTFKNNIATVHACDWPDSTSNGCGGAVYIVGNDTKVINCNFDSNHAEGGNGAAIYVEGLRTNITGTTFTNHESENGTVYIEGDNTNIQGCSFENNKAENGAGVFIEGQNTNIRGSTFDSNNATDGGAIYIDGDNSQIISNTFNKNNVTDQGGALFIQGSGSTINQNAFTYNEAVPASAEGTTGLGGAIYVKGDNTNTNSNTFTNNKARNGSAIYTDGNNFNLQHDIFGENQAWSYLLIITPEPEESLYNESDVNVTVVHVGGDNIINAIHNTASNNQIHFLDVTYWNNYGQTINTGNTVLEPVNGAELSENGTKVYQDDREFEQLIQLMINHEDGEVILPMTDLITNIYGNVTVTLTKPLRPGNYSVYAIHPEDWNYKVIENTSAFRVIPYVDISTDKDSDHDEYYVGDTVIWTITVHNAENGTNATNVTVTDKLPSGFAFVSYVATQGSYDNETGVWTIGNMTNGSTVQLTINSIATFADTYNNIANASSNEEDWNLTNNEDNKTVEVLPVVNLTIDKSVNVDTVYVGENVIFTINVTNNGPSNATMVKVEDVLPEQFEYVTSNDTSFSGNQIMIPKLNVGDSYLFTITAKTLINGTWNNTANATCKENDTVVEDNATVTVLPVVNLTIDKSVDLGHVKVGDTIVFTINVTNNGPSNATNVVIEDVVPEQFNVTGCSDPRFENNKITISYLNKGESIQFTITAIALINGTWNNTANVTCEENDTVVNDTVNVTVDPVVNLTIDKTVDIDHVFVGDTVVFTINVTNNGPSNATVVTIEDIVPEQFHVTGCNDSSYVDNKIIIDQLNKGESYAFTITATALIAGTWNNTANVTCKENDTVVEYNVTVIVDPVVNLTINKTVDNNHVQVGETVVFTINVTNNGPSNATVVTIEDIVPIQFGNVKCNDSRYVGNKIIIDQLNKGESIVFTINATALIAGTWNNTANVTCKENDTVKNDTVNVTVDPVVNLTIDKTVDVDHVHVGDTVVFTINVTNNGPSNATVVTIEDIVPEQFNVTACNDTQFANNKITVDKLNVGESYAFTITATALINGTWNNTANATCEKNDTVVNDTVTVVVDPVVNLTIDKAVDIDHVFVGDTVVFTINVTNNGPSNATVVTIEDIVPEQFNVTACNDTQFANNKITVDKLNVGESYAFTITATALIAGTWNNTANVTCKENDTVINDTVTVIVDPVVNLTINKTVEPGRVKVGETVVFTINVTNNGPSNATMVEITDIVPEQFNVTACNDSAFINNKIIIEKLNVGESYVITINATALIAGTWNNTASVFCAENDTIVNDTVNVTVDPVVNLTIDKAVDNNHVQVGDTIVFTINVTNNGPSNATVVVIEDIVPEQFQVTGCNDTSFNNNKLIIEKLNVGESYAFTITAIALINGTWNNTANVTCDENDTVVNDTVTVIVDPVVNLSINKTVEPGRVYVGETVLFTINITNNGPSNATQVEVTDIVPEQFTNVICNDSRYSNNKIIIAKLNVGESYVFTLNATALINGTWDNIASAFCAENDTVVEDDAIVIVDPVVNLTVNKTVEPGKVYVGETVVFTINVTNNGPSNATMVEITDVVPEQFGNVVCNDTRFENNKIIIERLDVNESIVFTLTATALTNGTWNNTASAFCEENETIVNDTINVTVDPIVDVSTEKTSDKDVYFIDDIAVWTITVHNANNASNATNVKLIESLPSEFEYIGYLTLNGTYDNETKIWDIGFMANGTDAELYIFARAIKVKDNVTNIVSVTCTEKDWNLSNNIANKTVDIIPLPDPEKNVSNSTPYYHDEVLYYLTISNTGNVTYENMLKVIDSLPEGLEFIRTVSIENAEQVGDESIEGQTITWTITNIPAFTKAVITVLVKVNALGNLTNNLTVIGPNGTNQTVNATIDPVPIVDLSTNKTSDKEEYFVDDIVIWSITVHNADNGTNATDVILKDEIPSQFEFINYTATKGTYDKETGIWNISFMENGTDATLTIWTIAKVDASQVTNTANVTCRETDWNLSNNVDNETVEIIPLPDPVKTVSNSTPYYHDIVEYNLTIINDGDIDYTNNLTVVDSLPEGLVFIETVGIVNGKFVGDEVIGTNNVTWVITNISAKTNATIIVKVKVEALGDLTNNLTIIGPNGTNKTVNETVTPVPIVDLSTDKTSDRDEYFVDDIAVWTITVHNADNGTNATNVALEDHIPTQFVFINYTATNGTYDHNTGIWTIGSMGNGTDATLTIWTRAVTPIDEVTNYANVSCYEDEWDLSNNDDEKTVSIIKLPEPQKTVSNTTPYNRDNVTYNLTITNVGNITYTNVLTVIDSLPEGLKFIETVGIDGADLIEEIADGQKITWTITNISAESSAVITVKVLVMDIGNQTNNLTIVGPNGTNSTVNCTIDPVPIADLAVIKINDYSTKVCYNGNNVTWTISVINNGPNDAINSIASDILPAGLIYVSDDSNGAYDPITGIWTIGNLSVGSSATLTIITTVATSNETITNYVNVTSDTYDPDKSNNEDNSSIVVEPEADLGIIKLVSNETVHKGDIVTWTLIVTNYGTDAAINVVVTDKLPKGLVHISDNSLGAYNPVTGIWKVGNLASGESATLKIKSLVTTTNKNITNLATVDSDTYDPDKSNNKANNSTTVPPECDLVLTIDPNVVEVTVGDEVEFTVTVVNKGPDAAENATAFIEIPEELKLLGFKPSKGTYDPETGIWTIGDLAPGEKVTLILDTEALETGKFIVKAHVVCDTYETDYTNNNDSAEVTVIEPPEPPVPGVPPQEMYPTGNPIVLALLSVLVIVGMTLRRKS